ncbi:hypothetical protein M3Y97_01076900 [Aphelenchoides bicaudatus]|nr:hypothetical protein M3Y97_01076900 [Aphelenchoides bicaudatus]
MSICYNYDKKLFLLVFITMIICYISLACVVAWLQLDLTSIFKASIFVSLALCLFCLIDLANSLDYVFRLADPHITYPLIAIPLSVFQLEIFVQMICGGRKIQLKQEDHTFGFLQLCVLFCHQFWIILSLI